MNTTTRNNANAVLDRDANAKQREVWYRPPVDLHEFPDRYELRADIPGAHADSIDIDVHEGVLSLEARVERRAGENAAPLLNEYGVGGFRRRIRLGEDVDTDAISAHYADGVLTLTLPKRAERRPRRVPVTRA